MEHQHPSRACSWHGGILRQLFIPRRTASSSSFVCSALRGPVAHMSITGQGWPCELLQDNTRHVLPSSTARWAKAESGNGLLTKAILFHNFAVASLDVWQCSTTSR